MSDWEDRDGGEVECLLLVDTSVEGLAGLGCKLDILSALGPEWIDLDESDSEDEIREDR